MKKLLTYLNPIAHLGEKNYSPKPAFITMLSLAAILEVYANEIAKNPDSVALFAVLLFIVAIIYFSFRNGVKGGVTATGITFIYYLYFIISRNASPEDQNEGIFTVFLLISLYALIALVIGWLKQTIDELIDREADEKRRLQTVIDQLPVGVLIADKLGIVSQANKQIEVILGKKIDVNDSIDRHILLGEQNNKKAVTPLTRVLKGRSEVKEKEFEFIRRDGKRMYIQVSAAAIHNRMGEMIAAASVINDTTSKKEMEQRKDDFINMASHELKTPITSMKLYLESLTRRVEGLKDERANKILHSIKGQTDKLQELASDLLDVSRLQTGKLSFSREKFRLDDLVQNTVEELQGATNNQKITLEQKPKILVFGDKFRIYQVLTNLITNASKYSPEGADILISIKRSKGKAWVGVQDHGIGIAKEQQQKIFDRLYQVTDPREKTFPGLGMGLYISKEIIKKHKGKIWVESEKDKGSTFFFTLPVTYR